MVFVNTWVLNDQQKELIKNRISKNNRHLIWIYAPGYSNEKELNKNFIEEVTGIKIKQVETNSPVTMITDSNITKQNRFTVFNKKIDPLFIADDKAIVLEKLDSIGGAAMVKKQQPGFTSWYMSIPPADIDLWRYVFKESGVHIYETGNDVLYAGNGVLSIHTLIGGERKIVLKNGKEITIVLQPDSTTVLNSVSGEIILK